MGESVSSIIEIPCVWIDALSATIPINLDILNQIDFFFLGKVSSGDTKSSLFLLILGAWAP